MLHAYKRAIEMSLLSILLASKEGCQELSWQQAPSLRMLPRTRKVDMQHATCAQVLVRLLRAEEGAPPAHLAALAGLPLSLHALEVVNRLTLARALPGGCVSAFVSGCIAACERAEARPPTRQQPSTL